ncbi:hypothetical protein TNCV_2327481 [Trichonephila clavipes]|nr:hypothetical protein TNCV_2327481 [Trichonephila clavipes]
MASFVEIRNLVPLRPLSVEELRNVIYIEGQSSRVGVEVWRCGWQLKCHSRHLTVVQNLHAEIVEVEIEVVSPSIVPSRNFAELNRTVTCMVLKANDRRTSCPCHDEFRGPLSDYVRQVALESNKQQQTTKNRSKNQI